MYEISRIDFSKSTLVQSVNNLHCQEAENRVQFCFNWNTGTVILTSDKNILKNDCVSLKSFDLRNKTFSF